MRGVRVAVWSQCAVYRSQGGRKVVGMRSSTGAMSSQCADSRRLRDV